MHPWLQINASGQVGAVGYLPTYMRSKYGVVSALTMARAKVGTRYGWA